MISDPIQEMLGPLRLSASELPAFAESLARPPRPAIRLRPGPSSVELPFPTDPVPWHDLGRFVTAGIRPGAYVHYGAGAYFIQDASSLLAVAALQVQPGDWVCDVCASPGGKATAILDSLESGGWLVANEAIASRVSLLRYQLARYGVPRFGLCEQDPEPLAEQFELAFDRVLVDAPCTGQSLVGRGKQTESAFQPQWIEHNAARQSRILRAAAGLVRPGGRLVYSTCTFSYAENESRIEQFLAGTNGWASVRIASLEQWSSPGFRGCYRLWPHRDGCGGAFVAVLERITADEEARQRRTVDLRRVANKPAPDNEIAQWGTLDDVCHRCENDRAYAWPKDPPGLIQRSLEGPEIAFRKGNTWFPSHSLAMRRDRRWTPRLTAELDDRAAAEYLRGSVVPTAVRGWAVARWRGWPLGWVKGDGRRGKNHLPKPARLSGRLVE